MKQMDRLLRSYTISTREFDRRVADIYTPSSSDNQYAIAKYTYEAQQVALHDLMKEAWIDASNEYVTLNEPFYLFLVGSGRIPRQIDNLLENVYLNSLVLVNVNWRDVYRILYGSNRVWGFNELHWLDDSMDSTDDITEYSQTLTNLDVSKNLKRLGLYGNAVSSHQFYQSLDQLEILTIDTMDSIGYPSTSRFPLGSEF